MDDDELMKRLAAPWITWALVVFALMCAVGLIFLPGPPP